MLFFRRVCGWVNESYDWRYIDIEFDFNRVLKDWRDRKIRIILNNIYVICICNVIDELVY